MAKKKQNNENSQIEEIDLSSIDIDSLMIPELNEDLSFLKFVPEDENAEKKSSKKEKKSEKIEEVIPVSSEKKSKKATKSEEISETEKNDEIEDFPKDADDFDDDFDFKDDFDDDFELEDGEFVENEKGDGYKAPKDFFTDKRRQKSLKKFLDVEVPAEYLEGLDENMQLLFKK